MNLLYEFHRGGNVKYFDKVLTGMGEGFRYTVVNPLSFLDLPGMDEFDVIVYHTFPDEKHTKHNPALVELIDQKFLRFGGHKILLDSFDWADRDGYTRFNGMFPRIKHIPGDKYIKKFEVILAVPHPVIDYLDEPPEEIVRTVRVHYSPKVGVYLHKTREKIWKVLKDKYSRVTSFDRIPTKVYEEFLRTVQISVTAEGFGPSAAAIQTLKSGALLLIEEKAIWGIQLLPFAELVDGEDYISFNMKTLKETLDWLLISPDDVERIRLSGQRKFFEGYDLNRSAKEFRGYLERTLGRWE